MATVIIPIFQKVFILLLRCRDELNLELRSFSNLLKSVSIHVNKLIEEEKYHLESQDDMIAVIGAGSLIFFNLATSKKATTIECREVASALFFPDGIGYCNKNGEIYRIQGEERILECHLSPLFPSIRSVTLLGGSYLVTVDGGILVADRKSPLDYEFYEFPAEKPRIIYFDAEKIVIFDKSQQICVIFDVKNPRKPSHLVHFSSFEYTVDVSLSQTYLYSLTSGGIISKWKLFPNGRHIRELVLNARLSHCKRFLYTSSQKFAIQTSDRLCFVIFTPNKLENS